MIRKFLKPLLAASAIMTSAVPALAVEVYVFRGAGDLSFVADGLSFSQGMDDLSAKIRASGIHAKTYRWQNGVGAMRDIRARKPRSVALLGHSMGALTAISLASQLRNEGIRVSYLGLIDIPGPIGTVPDGVMWAENFYSLFPVYGMLPVPRGHDGYIANKFVGGEIHTTMDNSRRVHDAMISAIWHVDDIDRGIREPQTLRAYAANGPAGTPSSSAGQGIDDATTASIRPIE